MKQGLKIVFLVATLSGCVHEFDRSVVPETSLLNEETSCREKHRFCHANCRTQHPYDGLNREKCLDTCEYQLTSCLNLSSFVVRRDPSVIVNPYAPMVIDPYPNVFVEPYSFWGGGGYYHHPYHEHEHVHEHGHGHGRR